MTARLTALRENVLASGALIATGVVAGAVALLLAGLPAWLVAWPLSLAFGAFAHWAQRRELASAVREARAALAWRISERLGDDDEDEELSDEGNEE